MGARRAGLVLLAVLAGPASAFDDGNAGFTVQAGRLEIPYRVFALYALPGDSYRLHSPGLELEAELLAGGGVLKPDPDAPAPGGWRWTAPAAPAQTTVRLRPRGQPHHAMELHLFSLVPIGRVQRERIGDYRIGRYPATPLRGDAAYLPPRGFVQVTAANAALPVSPHFRLGDFVSKQAQGYPRYVVLRPRLLLKLEFLLRELNREGLAVNGFHVMSGYRTPYYNAAIGNVKYSRHVYGGAADIFIDERPRDGVMDDLDGNGRVTRDDARLLRDLVERISRRDGYAGLEGGLGLYGATAAHGPFVHVDVRGHRARW